MPATQQFFFKPYIEQYQYILKTIPSIVTIVRSYAPLHVAQS
jgi:hypothetical protein